jgi:hypothetical protein
MTYHAVRSSRLNLKAAGGVKVIREKIYRKNNKM